MLIPDVFDGHALALPEKDAVVCGPVRRHWRDFNRNINRVANAPGAAGVSEIAGYGAGLMAGYHRATEATAVLEFRDDFPRNALGKVFKRLLRAPYWRRRGARGERAPGLRVARR